MAIKVGGLFAVTTNKPEVIAKPENILENTTAVVIQSLNDHWISYYHPEAENDRFVLMDTRGDSPKIYACKFYNRFTDTFLGSSLLAMYTLNERYDRSIIPAEEGL